MEELKKNKFNADRIVEQVNIWQNSPYVKHLTCRECGAKLTPKKEGSKVCLKCPDCNWSQPYVPKPVIEYKMEFPSVLKRNSCKHNHLAIGAIEKLDNQSSKK